MTSGLSCSYLISSVHIWYLGIKSGLRGSVPVSGNPFWSQWLLYGLNGSLMFSGAPKWSQGLPFGDRRLVSSLGLISNHRGSYLVSKNSYLVSAAHF